METPLVMSGFSPERFVLAAEDGRNRLEMVAAEGWAGIRCGHGALGQGDCGLLQARGERSTGARRPGDCGHLHGDLH